MHPEEQEGFVPDSHIFAFELDEAACLHENQMFDLDLKHCDEWREMSLDFSSGIVTWKKY